jgi:hypothetical protein
VRSTTFDDTFLMEDDDQIALLIVGPAARKVVATMWIFTSPYVNCTQRREDRAAMCDALRANDELRFYELARKYEVTHILVSGKGRELVEKTTVRGISPLFSWGAISAYRVNFVYLYGPV